MKHKESHNAVPLAVLPCHITWREWFIGSIKVVAIGNYTHGCFVFWVGGLVHREVVLWVEHVLDHAAKPNQTPSGDVPWWNTVQRRHLRQQKADQQRDRWIQLKDTHIPSNIHQPSVRTTPRSTAQEVKQRAILAWRGSEWHGWWPVHPQDPILWYMHEPHLGGGWGCSVGLLCFLICCKDVKNQEFILAMKLP